MRIACFLISLYTKITYPFMPIKFWNKYFIVNLI